MRQCGLVLVEEPGHRGAKIVVLGFQPVEPGHLAGALQPGGGGLGELEEMGGVPVVRFPPLTAGAQPVT
jgi:hypothetical protein